MSAATLPATGLTLHLDAGQGVTFDGSNNVSSWADQSGNTNDFTQANAAFQPTYVANNAGFNNLPTFSFAFDDTGETNTGSFLSRSDSLGFTGNPAMTVFVVMAATGERPFQFGDTGASNGGEVAGFDADASWRFNNGFRQYANDNIDDGTLAIGTWWKDTGDFYDEVLFAKNGPTPATATSASGTASTTELNIPTAGSADGLGAAVGMGWGSDQGLDQPYNGINGDIAELIVYDRALSETELNEVGFYLQEKYGVAGNFVPEPGSLALLGAGGLLMLARRRRA
ncbi:MAG: PEP-CTERM sorting domain-containing protein [Phycisphaeraceae bacterium]